jgi:hypothetical protein
VLCLVGAGGEIIAHCLPPHFMPFRREETDRACRRLALTDGHLPTFICGKPVLPGKAVCDVHVGRCSRDGCDDVTVAERRLFCISHTARCTKKDCDVVVLKGTERCIFHNPRCARDACSRKTLSSSPLCGVHIPRCSGCDCELNFDGKCVRHPMCEYEGSRPPSPATHRRLLAEKAEKHRRWLANQKDW